MIGKQLSIRDHTDLEQTWLDLLSTDKIDFLDYQYLLDISIQSKCYRVVEYLYDKEKYYDNILMCYLQDPLRKSDIFKYILNYINVKERFIQEQFVNHFKDIVRIDCKKTAEIVVEHFPQLVEDMCSLLDSDYETQYFYLNEIVYSDLKLAPELAEKYLNLLCIYHEECVINFIKLRLCRVEEALKITDKHKNYHGTAILLEQIGDYNKALDLLLENNMANLAVDLCIRASEDTDSQNAQALWLKLLKYPLDSKFLSLRQLLHAAAPHVPPAQLLELVSHVQLSDIEELFKGILTDYRHDIDVLKTTLKLLSKDLHQGNFFSAV